MSGKVHASAALIPGKDPRVPLSTRECGHQTGPGEDTRILKCRNINISRDEGR